MTQIEESPFISVGAKRALRGAGFVDFSQLTGLAGPDVINKLKVRPADLGALKIALGEAGITLRRDPAIVGLWLQPLETFRPFRPSAQLSQFLESPGGQSLGLERLVDLARLGRMTFVGVAAEIGYGAQQTGEIWEKIEGFNTDAIHWLGGLPPEPDELP